jgi:xanthine dehydrogenase YagS FAD-binding subunit
MDGAQVKQARIALGGVAHKPWRAMEAEKFLKRKAATKDNFKLAAEIAMKGTERCNRCRTGWKTYGNKTP